MSGGNRARALVVLALMTMLAREASPSYATAPGTAGALVYQARAGTHVQLFRVGADGRGRHQLTHLRACDAINPSWSPDGTRLAFACDYAAGTKKEHLDIYTMRPNGSGLHALGLRGLNGAPTWMADGRLLWLQPGGFATSDPDGSSRRVIHVGGDVASPTVSPDGTQIAFLRALPKGRRAIFIVDADGTHAHRVLTSPHGLADKIDWSPDGSRIAYSSPDFGLPGLSSNVYTVRVSGGSAVELTHEIGGTVNDGFDTWSPDGRKIAFTSNRAGSYSIYVMNADGSGVTRLTHGLDAHLASWGVGRGSHTGAVTRSLAASRRSALTGTWDSGEISMARVQARALAGGYSKAEFAHFLRDLGMTGSTRFEMNLVFYSQDGVPYVEERGWDPSKDSMPTDADHGPYVLLAHHRIALTSADPTVHRSRDLYAYGVTGDALRLRAIAETDPAFTRAQLRRDAIHLFFASSAPLRKVR